MNDVIVNDIDIHSGGGKTDISNLLSIINAIKTHSDNDSCSVSTHNTSTVKNICDMNSVDGYSTISISTGVCSISSRGRHPGKCTYSTVDYNGLYIIVTIQYKNKDIKFIIDHDNLAKIRDKSWHLSSGKYIATNIVLEDGSIKELYLHNFLMDKVQPADDAAKEYVIHINNNMMDNRIKNLRIVDSIVYYHGKSKRKRTVVLPADCGFKSDDIPKYVSYVKADGSHGDRFVIEIPRLNLFQKLSCSKKITLQSKLDEAIQVLNAIYKEHPEVNPNADSELKNQLQNEFNAILASKVIHSEESIPYL